MAGPQLRITFDTSGGRGGVRDAGGRFLGMSDVRQAFRDANERMAREVQAQVVENVAGSVQRRNVSSGRLVSVTASPRNKEVSDFHFGVGLPKFLDQSMAKYWRTIEEGSEKTWVDTPGGRSSFIGMELKGLWGGSLGKVTADRAYAAKPWSRHGADRQGKFVPTSRTFNFRGKYTGTGGKSGAPNFAQTAIVKHEIDPHYDYAHAADAVHLGTRAVAEVNAILGKAARASWRVEH